MPSNARATVAKLKGLAASHVALWLQQRPAMRAKEAEGQDRPVSRYLDLAERHRKLRTWHALAVDVHLRPLLVELGATVPMPGLAVLESDPARLDVVLDPWAARVGEVVGGDARAPVSALAVAS